MRVVQGGRLFGSFPDKLVIACVLINHIRSEKTSLLSISNLARVVHPRFKRKWPVAFTIKSRKVYANGVKLLPASPVLSLKFFPFRGCANWIRGPV
mgnify:CR=1 FL=1